MLGSFCSMSTYIPRTSSGLKFCCGGGKKAKAGRYDDNGRPPAWKAEWRCRAPASLTNFAIELQRICKNVEWGIRCSNQAGYAVVQNDCYVVDLEEVQLVILL
jgi:hypothetical protein